MAYSRNQKHRNQSDTNVRNHNPKKKSFKRKKRLTREDFQIPGLPRAVKVPDGNIEQALRRFKKMMKHLQCMHMNNGDLKILLGKSSKY